MGGISPAFRTPQKAAAGYIGPAVGTLTHVTALGRTHTPETPMETARQTAHQTASVRGDPEPSEVGLRQSSAHLAPSGPLAHMPVGVLPWSDELLSQFGLRMASHGMSISRTQMRSSPGYALQQLAHARALGDDTLDLLVCQLFRCFEAHQSGVHPPSH
jgi:hypothetical protein